MSHRNLVMELSAHPSPHLNCSHQITYTKFWKESTVLNFTNMEIWHYHDHIRKTIRRSHRTCSIKRYSWKFHKIHRKTPVPESLFNKVASLRLQLYIMKETLAQVLSCEFCEIFKNIFFYRRPLVPASVSY